ncbi:hypothetical protein R1sor_011562 [Riccia sorocarpa]|uniref:non-specific serine/threonine protein kinase n=1 Tax=Riccia sorocarpa TaxID=122646 RepID=A0ABD3I2J8_9MARC
MRGRYVPADPLSSRALVSPGWGHHGEQAYLPTFPTLGRRIDRHQQIGAITLFFGWKFQFLDVFRTSKWCQRTENLMESGLQILKKWTIKAPHGTSQRSREKSDKKPQKQQKVEQTHQIEDNHADVDMEGSKGSDRGENENESPPSQSDTPKETESPRFQALLRMTGGPKKKKLGNDIKSYSHELDPRGVRSHDYWKLHSFNDLEKFLGALRAKFNSAKEEVNNELKVFAVDLIEILERHADQSPSWQEQAEDLLVLARKCTLMSPNEFRKQCDKIVAELDDKRQMLPMGILKQLHTRMLFILTRCTRLLQFQKSSSSDEEIPTHKSHQLTNFSQPLDGAWTLRNSDKGKTKISIHDLSRQKEPFEKLSNPLPSASSSLGPKKPEDQGTTSATSKKNDRPKPFLGDGADLRQDKVMSEVDSLIQDRLRSWKRSTVRPDTEGKDKQAPRKESLEREDGATTGQDPLSRGFGGQQQTLNSSSRQQSLGTPTPRVAWGYWGDQPTAVEDLYFVICRICEEEVPTLSLEEHSKVCAFVDRCDHKSQNIDERLLRLADALERMLESYTPKASAAGSTLSPEPGRVLSGPGSTGDLLESIFDKSYGLNRKGSEDMLEDLHDLDAASIDDPKGSFSAMTCKTRFGPKSDVGVASSSGGSLTPRSPVATPRVASQFDQWLPERNSLVEPGDPIQMSELADIARCVANSNPADHYSVEYLYSCMQDLAEVLQQNKIVALTVDTFGKRIEKLLREKYTLVCDLAEQNGLETSSNGPDEEGCYMEDDGFPSRQSTPVHPSSLKDRTTINDFEIIKPISRGAFGRVFLARKRTTGDLFAIKVLRKVDMIRKNQVESVQAERNILISARNPFVVRFFYSFTCRENLYLVMEYLNGGDLYSMLRNMGCLPEHIARHYIAELVLALEYLHSLGVVHRDLKPDNLLIAHDGHIKLTDFGLSRVGLINSTDDLSGPAAVCIQVEEPSGSAEEHSRRERRQQQSAVGTPDYLAPEILLGTGHGTTADWWSTGVILFEFLTGVPPFNADHPQVIFDNILNRKIPWPHVPEEMSDEAQDLIDRLLTEDPNERLGARGAAEVKAHPFFKDIEWDTLARQKAAFVPSPDTAHDTSYFITRSAWNQSDSRVFPENDLGDSTDLDCSNSSGSNSSMDAGREEGEDECREIPPFDSHVHWSFSNFSFKNLSQLASINYDILFQTERSSPKGPS